MPRWSVRPEHEVMRVANLLIGKTDSEDGRIELYDFTYCPTEPWITTVSGTKEKPIHIIAAEGATPVIDFTGLGTNIFGESLLDLTPPDSLSCPKLGLNVCGDDRTELEEFFTDRNDFELGFEIGTSGRQQLLDFETVKVSDGSYTFIVNFHVPRARVAVDQEWNSTVHFYNEDGVSVGSSSGQGLVGFIAENGDAANRVKRFELTGLRQPDIDAGSIASIFAARGCLPGSEKLGTNTGGSASRAWTFGKLSEDQLTIMKQPEHLHVEGLTITNSPSIGIVNYGNDITFEELVVSNHCGNGIALDGRVDQQVFPDQTEAGSQRNTIINSKIYGNFDLQSRDSGNDADGILVNRGAKHNRIINNEVYNNSDHGIDVYTAGSTLIYGNEVYQNGRGTHGNGDGIQLGDAAAVLLEPTVDTCDDVMDLRDLSGVGHHVVSHNLIWNNKQYGLISDGGPSLIFNNTAWANGDHDYQLQEPTTIRNCRKEGGKEDNAFESFRPTRRFVIKNNVSHHRPGFRSAKRRHCVSEDGAFTIEDLNGDGVNDPEPCAEFFELITNSWQQENVVPPGSFFVDRSTVSTMLSDSHPWGSNGTDLFGELELWGAELNLTSDETPLIRGKTSPWSKSADIRFRR